MSTTTCYSAPAAVPGAGGAAVASEAAAADHQSSKNNLILYANLPAADIIDSLPLETRFPVPNRLYGGFWKAEFLLKGLAAGRTRTGTGFDSGGRPVNVEGWRIKACHDSICQWPVVRDAGKMLQAMCTTDYVFVVLF